MFQPAQILRQVTRSESHQRDTNAIAAPPSEALSLAPPELPRPAMVGPAGRLIRLPATVDPHSGHG